MDGDAPDSESPSSGPSTLPAWVPTLLIAIATASVPSFAGYLAVEKHAQRMKESEQLLAREQFEAEQVAKYLTLEHKDVLTKRAMASYLQAIYFRAGESTLHRWATTQLDLIDEDKRLRAQRVDAIARELGAARSRRKQLTDRRTDLEAQLAQGKPGQRKDLESKLADTDTRLAAAAAEVDRLESKYEEETRQTLDLTKSKEAAHGTCWVTAQSAEGEQTLARRRMTEAECVALCVDPEQRCKASFQGSIAVGVAVRGGVREPVGKGAW